MRGVQSRRVRGEQAELFGTRSHSCDARVLYHFTCLSCTLFSIARSKAQATQYAIHYSASPKYICPVCGGRNLSIDSETGKYHCFTSDCATADIREAIRPWAEVLVERQAKKAEKEKQKPQKKVVAVQTLIPLAIPVPIPSGLKLLRLPAPQRGPEPQKPDYLPKDVPAEALQITYRYSDSQFVLRWEWLDPESPKGRDKTYRQAHIADDGKRVGTNTNFLKSCYR